MANKWNPRYVQYALAHGKNPESMLEHDDSAWPGGRMCGYMLWISRQWQDWRAARNYRLDSIIGPEEQADFDRWLSDELIAKANGPPAMNSIPACDEARS